MEPSGVCGIGEQFKEGCSGSVASFGVRPSYLSLMASVAPQYDGLVQPSSIASWCNYDNSINQLPCIPPSVDSAVQGQPFSPNCSRSYKEMTFHLVGKESNTGHENQTMQHFQQQIACGYSLAQNDCYESDLQQIPYTSDEEMPFPSSGEGYSGDESDVLPENEPMKHTRQEIACGYYSSTKEDTCQRMHENMLVAGVEEEYHHQNLGNKQDVVSANQSIKQNEHDVAVGYSSAEDGPYKPVVRWGRTSPLAHNEKIMGAVEQAMRKSGDGPKEPMFLPKLGAVFPSLGDAFQFYNLYSWEVGFSIRKHTNQGKKENSDGTTLYNMQEYTCQRAGKPGSGTKFSTTMCGCPARLRLLRNENNQYYVSIFVPEHNHELVESCGEKRHLRSHQSIDQSTKEMVRCLRENNVGFSQVNNIMGSLSGSMNNLNFSKKQLKTVCSKIAVDLIADDIQKTMISFMKMRDEDPNFVYAFQMDKDCRITSLMWSSGYSRRMYSYFADVVTFDTTYKTNIYKMPFGMFVGVNNHFQSVIYAGVLLTSETTESFAWAFKTFVEMMGGKAPVTMLTDQAAAMGAALRQVLKETIHRWCKWHVLKKVVEVLGYMFKDQDFCDDFNKVVNHMLTKKEFEDSWLAMVDKYGLSGNPEITRAFESRSMWAKAWFKDIFCARMTSTQRSESANNVLKHFVPRNSSMNLFVQQYIKLVTEQEKADNEEEKNTKQLEIRLRFGWPIERHAAKLYTRQAYQLFLEELGKSCKYVVKSNDLGVYNVVHGDSEHREKWSKVDFKVIVDGESGSYDCECGLYKHFGILCCHALLVMVQKGVPEIPVVHIMNRWTRAARFKEPSHLLPATKPSGAIQSKVLKRTMLDRTYSELTKLADSDSECLDFAMKELTSVLKKMQAKRDAVRTSCHVGYESSGTEGCGEGTSGTEAFSDSERRSLQIVDSRSGVAININSIKPPIFERTMGRPTNVREKSETEIRIRSARFRRRRNRKQYPYPGGSGAVKQSRHCKKCRSSDHDVRRCPEINLLPPIGEENDLDDN